MIERFTKDGKKLAWVGSDEPRTDVQQHWHIRLPASKQFPLQ